MAKNSSPRIQEPISRAKTQKREGKKPKIAKASAAERITGDSQYAEVVADLKSMKQELNNLKLDMAFVLQEKRRVEQETDSSLLNMVIHANSLKTIRREIEETNEEHVLVELAKIEAIKEYGEIEVQRKEKNERFLKRREVTRNKMKKMAREIENARKLENKLAVTLSDINLLENGLKKIKEMVKRTERNESSKFSCLLDSVTKELEAAKKELDAIREGGFQLKASMDVVRNELKQAMEETLQQKKKDRITEMLMQKIYLKLLRAKAKLEAKSTAENKAKTKVSNLSLTLERLKSESEASKNDLSYVSEETAIIRQEVLITDTEIDLAEGKLEEASQELEAVKSSELIALENLRAQIEITMGNRASTTQHSSKITISKFEYEYLIRHADTAKEIADKKVAAAHAWIEALKASEKENIITAELSRRETRELKVEEEHKVPDAVITFSSKTTNQIFEMTPAKKAKTRRASYPMGRRTFRPKSFAVRRRKEISPTTSPVL
ncbi:protein PLASTID MOVEMENT IMPAIRED 2-like [Primulina huaijiensis]|uniref:protein PLASTID MOVEMENT IMPAIRED 2-like n=1 Tax=Primulina huaijiensis TaxID=1492673 RepID=UPI003CC71B48